MSTKRFPWNSVFFLTIDRKVYLYYNSGENIDYYEGLKIRKRSRTEDFLDVIPSGETRLFCKHGAFHMGLHGGVF